MFRDRVFKTIDQAREVDNVRLIIQAPVIGIHQPVIGFIHRLIHPDRVRYVKADRHFQFSTFRP